MWRAKLTGIGIALLVLVGALGGLLFYGTLVTKTPTASQPPAIAVREQDSTQYEVLTTATTTQWRVWFPVTYPMMIGDTPVEASVANTMEERELGLSGTPYLPAVVVKLFTFDEVGRHSFWMKDMNYAIDMLWVDKEGSVVHIENDVSPDTYPAVFGPGVPALYVIEAAAGFSKSHDIVVGTKVVLP